MNYKLSDLIDIEKSRRLLDSFCDVVGITAALMDLEGEVIVGSRGQRICTDFHRVNERACEKCIESDTQLANELEQGKRFSIYKCRNGLTDAASPIIIEDEHIANAFVGQFLLKTPDREFFRQQADTYGFEEAVYLEALSEVPIVTEKNLPAILDFLTTFAEIVAHMGLEHLGQIESEEALRESEEQYKMLVNNLPVAVYRNTPGPEGKFLMANPAFIRMFGFKNEEELKDVSPAALYQNPEERKQYSDNLLKMGVIKNDKRTLLKRDGTPIFTSITSRVVHGKDGGVSHFDSIMLDITEQTLTEEALRESEEKYRTILENMEEGYYEVDLAGNFTFVNDAMCRIRSISRDELIGMNNREYMTPETTKEVYEAFNKVYTTGEPARNLEWETIRQDGTIRYVESSASLIKGSGDEPTGFRGVVRDVTERRRAEEALRVSEEKLARSKKMESLGLLAGGVAHDLNNVLSGIVSYPELILMDLPQDSKLKNLLRQCRSPDTGRPLSSRIY